MTYLPILRPNIPWWKKANVIPNINEIKLKEYIEIVNTLNLSIMILID